MNGAAVREQQGAQWEREAEDLFREHYAFMYRAAKALLGQPDDAEDVVQSLFLKFAQRELRSEIRENPRAYLYRAAGGPGRGGFKARFSGRARIRILLRKTRGAADFLCKPPESINPLMALIKNNI